MATSKGRLPRDQSLQPISVRLNWEESGAPFVLADQVFVRWVGDVYQVTFGVVPGASDPEPNLEELQKTGVKVYPVARVAITPANMRRILGQLNLLHERFSQTEQQP